MTLKKALLRGLAGIPIGVFVGYTITLILSLFWGQGRYSPVVPAVVETVGSEIGAVALQYVLLCLMGFLYALASCIWSVEHWSLTRQTVCHFLAITLGTLPIVLICRWAEYMPGGILGYFGIFGVVYAVLWLALTMSTRREIREVNRKIGGK